MEKLGEGRGGGLQSVELKSEKRNWTNALMSDQHNDKRGLLKMLLHFCDFQMTHSGF